MITFQLLLYTKLNFVNEYLSYTENRKLSLLPQISSFSTIATLPTS